MIKHCRDCPIECVNETAEQMINYGCLPDRYDAYKWFKETGRAWACHAKPDRICGGFLKLLIEKGETIDFSKPLITEQTPGSELSINLEKVKV